MFVFSCLLVIFLSVSCVDRKYVILISDTHIGGDNFAGVVTEALPRFMRLMTENDTNVHTFALVGDFIDFWGRNYSEPNPTAVELLEMQDYKGVNVSEYVDLLKQIMNNGLEVKYVRGNHDIQVSFDDLKEVGLGDVIFYEQIWEEFNIHVEHGNRFDLWNSPDPSEVILPFGYYITRSYYEGGGYQYWFNQDEENTIPSFLTWMCDNILAYLASELQDVPWIYERVIGGALGETVWGEIANKKYKEYEHKNLVAGCVYSDWKDEEMYRAVQKYTSTVRRCIEKYGLEYTQNLIRGMCQDASWFYENMISENIDLLVQGHYHTPKIELYKTTKKKDLLMANTGAWTTTVDYLPFVRITQIDKKNATFVELMEYNDETGEFILKSSSYVPYRDSTTNTVDRKKKKRYSNPSPPEEFFEKKRSQKKKKPPSGWICDEDWYGSNDGCDCGCGIPDPDCSCTHQSTENCEYSCCSND